jgi:alkylation response protein AidB-like acyl-CoA dehydrogenase
MDVLIDNDERMVLDQARAFLSEACPPSLVRACEFQPKYSPDLWAKLVRLGWLETSLPEDKGGLGLPLHYLCLLFEEVGRHLAPIPLLSVMVPSLVIAEHGSAHHAGLLGQALTGDALFSFAFQDGSEWFPEAIRMVGHREGDAFVLNGTKSFVDNFAISDRCLVAFRVGGHEAGLTLALVDTSAANLSHADLVPTAKDSQARVRFDNVRVPMCDIVGEIGKADPVVRRAMDLATLFGSAQMIGAARRSTEMAVEYAKQRVAFEQPIGSFQSIQHLCADMLIGVDGAELLCREAAWKLGQGQDARLEISQAKAFANEKCVMACRSSQQIHGGIGFMMEYDLQLWYRRVVSWSLRHGTTAEHRRRLADSLLRRTGRIRLDD